MPPHSRTILGHLRRSASPLVSDAVLLARWLDQRDEAAFADLMAHHGRWSWASVVACSATCSTPRTPFRPPSSSSPARQPSCAGRKRWRAFSTASPFVWRGSRAARSDAGCCRCNPHSPNRPILTPIRSTYSAAGSCSLCSMRRSRACRRCIGCRCCCACCKDGRSRRRRSCSAGAADRCAGRLAHGRERLRERLTRRGLCPSVATLVLLAPVVVPDRLRAESIRNLAAPVSPAVNTLAAGSTSTLKLKAICLGLLIVAVGVGIGLPFLATPIPEAPSTAAPAAPPAQAKNEPRRDRYGDPLPPGAVARLGTLRFRAPAEVEALAFTPDGNPVELCWTFGDNGGLIAGGKGPILVQRRFREIARGAASRNVLTVLPWTRAIAARWHSLSLPWFSL